MKKFVSAALPWVLMGLALAVLAASLITKKQKNEKRGTYIALGAGLGLLLGAVLNSCGLWADQALGYAMGPLWGMAIASLIPGRENNEQI